MSKWRKENPAFLGKHHSEEYVEKLRLRISGANNPAEQIRKLLMWDKLPNPGNAWKFLIPNYINSGWTNYSWVISQKMIEKEMGNRGSKFY